MSLLMNLLVMKKNVFIFCLLMTGLPVFGQQNEVSVCDSCLGVIYDKNSNEFFCDTILKAGPHSIEAGKTVYEVNLTEQHASGQSVISSHDIHLSFGVTYVVKASSACDFASLVGDAPYERMYLVPQLEKLIFDTIVSDSNADKDSLELQELASNVIDAFANEGSDFHRFILIKKLTLRHEH